MIPRFFHIGPGRIVPALFIADRSSAARIGSKQPGAARNAIRRIEYIAMSRPQRGGRLQRRLKYIAVHFGPLWGGLRRCRSPHDRLTGAGRFAAFRAIVARHKASRGVSVHGGADVLKRCFALWATVYRLKSVFRVGACIYSTETLKGKLGPFMAVLACRIVAGCTTSIRANRGRRASRNC